MTAPPRRRARGRRAGPLRLPGTLSVGGKSRTTVPVRRTPRAIPVDGVARPMEVRIASDRWEWEQAFRLASANCQAIGAEPPSRGGLRFTPYHALPDTTTFVALHEGPVVAAVSLVLDNVLLGLPAETLYPDEVGRLRRAGRRIVEVTSLADRGLSVREFVPVFVALARLMTHFAIAQGADAMVITCRPRHGPFYQKKLGFEPFGPARAYPAVQNYMTEAFLLDVPRLSVNERIKEFGTLKAMGADDRCVARFLLAQALGTAALGSAVGLLAALAIGSLLTSPRAPVVLTWGVALGSVAVVVLVCASAAWLPYLRIRRLDPAGVLRS